MIQRLRFAAQFLCHPLGQLERREERHRLVAPDALHLPQIVHRRQRQRLERVAVFFNQLRADFDGVRSAQTGPHENGYQFSRTERRRAVFGQPFARAFAGGLVLKSQALKHERILSRPSGKNTRKNWDMAQASGLRFWISQARTHVPL